MADFTIVRSLIGDSYEIRQGTADEALEAGDICNFDSDGELEVVDDAADEEDLVIVLQDAAVDETGVDYVWLDPWILIEGTMKGTLGKVGDIVHLDVTSNVITVEAAAAGAGQKLGRFMIREVVDATTVRVVRSEKPTT